MKYALLSYSATGNIGDEIQSIAAEQFLPRVDTYFERDNLINETSSDLTKIILNGWFTHKPNNFFINQNIHPFFISFHVSPTVYEQGKQSINKSFLDFLKSSVEHQEILKKFSPIGARDLFTYRALKEFDIPTFFSGCLTLTLNPNPLLKRGEDIVLIDVPDQLIEYVRHISDRRLILAKHSFINFLDSKTSFSRAHKSLDQIQQAHLVITSRLHAAMPSLALGTPVILVGNHLDDPRFEGLKELVFSVNHEEFMCLPKSSFDCPPPNPKDYLLLRQELIERVQLFINQNNEDNFFQISSDSLATLSTLLRSNYKELSQYQHKNEKLQFEIEKLKLEEEKLKASLADLTIKNRQVEAEQIQLKAQIEQCQLANLELGYRIEQYQSENRQLHNEISQYEVEDKQLQTELNVIQASLSWKIALRLKYFGRLRSWLRRYTHRY